MKKTVFGLLFIAIIFCAAMAINSSFVPAFSAGDEISHKINSFTIEEGIKNAKDGCKITGYFTSAATEITKVTYTQVKIDNQGQGELITVDNESGEIFINGEAVADDRLIKESEEVSVNDCVNPTAQKNKYIEVTAKEWSAFIFAVYYQGLDGEEVTYDSEIVCCTSIDSGIPEVYRTGNWIVSGDSILYEVMIRSDPRNQMRSYDSGLDFFVVYKGNQEIDRVNNIGNTFYTYTLSVSLKEVAYYEIHAADNAGNSVMKLRLAENNNTSYDLGFESAVKNALSYLKDNVNYNEKVRADLEKSYYDYYMVIQKADSTTKQKEDAKEVALYYLTEYARLKKLESAGEKEWSLYVVNTEYLSGEISLKNVNTAFADLKYGEKAKISITLATFDPKKVDKSSEMAIIGVEKCREIVSFTLSTEVNSELYLSKLTSPLQIAVPYGDYKNLKATITFLDENGNEVIEEVDITEYKDYIVLNSDYSYGTINLFVDNNLNNPLLWLLTLLILPLGGGVTVVIINIKKKKSKLEDKNDRHPRKKGRTNN